MTSLPGLQMNQISRYMSVPKDFETLIGTSDTLFIIRNISLLEMGKKSNAKRQSQSGAFKIGDFLYGNSSKYQIKKFLGQGVYGKVAECIKLSTKEMVAVKILRKKYAWIGRKEVAMLQELKQLDDPAQANLVKFMEHFVYREHVCLVFEMLDKSLHNLMKERSFKPLPLAEIKEITQQMLEALNALKNIHLVHADIKPDNIMLVNHKFQHLNLKLIDFGLALPARSLFCSRKIQAVGYRAPEVILGLPMNEAVDMWALGCNLAFLFLGRHLYPVQSEHEVLRVIVQMQGQPDDDLLNHGLFTSKYFKKDKHPSHAPWRLIGSPNAQTRGLYDKFTSFNDMAKTRRGLENTTYNEDTQAFLSLLRSMLQVDPEKRITPSEALQHPFITMKHFPSDTANTFVKSTFTTTKNCQLEQSFKSKHFVTSCKVKSRTGASITNLDDPLSAAEETAGNTKNKPPVSASSVNTTTAGIDNKPPGTNEAGYHNSGGINTGREKGPRSFSLIKTWRKWIKSSFFSKLIMCSRCSSSDVID